MEFETLDSVKNVLITQSKFPEKDVTEWFSMLQDPKVGVRNIMDMKELFRGKDNWRDVGLPAIVIAHIRKYLGFTRLNTPEEKIEQLKWDVYEMLVRSVVEQSRIVLYSKERQEQSGKEIKE